MSRDPAAEWQQAKLSAPFAAHCAMADALRQSPGNSFELQPFAPMLVEGVWYIGCNFDGDILLVGAKDGVPQFFGGGRGFYGPTARYDAPLALYTNGIPFARDWAANRALAYANADTIARHSLTMTAASAHCPGMVAVGDLASFTNFADIATAPAIHIDNPRLRHVLNDAMLRAANLPPVTVMQPKLRAVA